MEGPCVVARLPPGGPPRLWKSAVVKGHCTAVGQVRGVDVSGELRYTDVYVKREGRWQAVASQITRIGGSARIL